MQKKEADGGLGGWRNTGHQQLWGRNSLTRGRGEGGEGGCAKVREGEVDGCIWQVLLCMATTDGYNVWLLCMATMYGNYVWQLCMATILCTAGATTSSEMHTQVLLRLIAHC